MKIHLASVAMLALGLSVSCSADAADAESKSASKGSGTPDPMPDPTPDPTPEPTPEPRKVENVDAAAAAKLIAENAGVVILDIRTPAEFQRGHLKGAVNIDYKAGDYAEKLGELDKEKTYLVH